MNAAAANIICRLRENRFNSLEDILLEAADAIGGDGATIIQLVSRIVSKREESLNQGLLDIQSEAKDEDSWDEGYREGRDAASNECAKLLESLTGSEPVLATIEKLQLQIEKLRP